MSLISSKSLYFKIFNSQLNTNISPNQYGTDRIQKLIHQSCESQLIQSIPCPWDRIPRTTSNQDKISPTPPTLVLTKTILTIWSFVPWFFHFPYCFLLQLLAKTVALTKVPYILYNITIKSLIRTVFPPGTTTLFICPTTQEFLKEKLFWKKLLMILWYREFKLNLLNKLLSLSNSQNLAEHDADKNKWDVTQYLWFGKITE